MDGERKSFFQERTGDINIKEISMSDKCKQNRKRITRETGRIVKHQLETQMCDGEKDEK